MTAIACRAGVIAADSSVWYNELQFPGVTATKIFPVKAGDVGYLAFSGNRSSGEALWRWVEDDMREDRRPNCGEDFSALWLTRESDSVRLRRLDTTLEWTEETAPFIAEGAHADFLMGAMAAGASAEEAVRLAIEHCAFARGPLVVRRV